MLSTRHLHKLVASALTDGNCKYFYADPQFLIGVFTASHGMSSKREQVNRFLFTPTLIRTAYILWRNSMTVGSSVCLCCVTQFLHVLGEMSF